jgi:hypothetical protein
MTNLRMTFVLLLAGALCSAPAHAQDNRGTAEQRAACAGDAFRLCASDIPEAKRVEACLRRSQAGLSPACRAVFERNTISLAGTR